VNTNVNQFEGGNLDQHNRVFFMVIVAYGSEAPKFNVCFKAESIHLSL